MDIREIGDITDFEVELNDWWAKARYRELKKAIPLTKQKYIVEIGCGSAQNLFFIDRDYPHLRLLGVEDKCREVSYSWLPDRIEIIPKINYKLFDADVYLLMDVIEHIQDDGEFLSMIVEQAKRQSRFFISVPAFNMLWSQRDEELRHYRRYTKRSLSSVCATAGITIERCYYKFSFLFPALYFLKRQAKTVGIHRPWCGWPNVAGAVLDVICRIEELLPRAPFGTSIILVGTKT